VKSDQVPGAPLSEEEQKAQPSEEETTSRNHYNAHVMVAYLFLSCAFVPNYYDYSTTHYMGSGVWNASGPYYALCGTSPAYMVSDCSWAESFVPKFYAISSSQIYTFRMFIML
jgi:hypothetical protein